MYIYVYIYMCVYVCIHIQKRRVCVCVCQLSLQWQNLTKSQFLAPEDESRRVQHGMLTQLRILKLLAQAVNQTSREANVRHIGTNGRGQTTIVVQRGDVAMQHGIDVAWTPSGGFSSATFDYWRVKKGFVPYH